MDFRTTLEPSPKPTETARPPAKGAEIAIYHFHLHDGAFVPDRDGIELPDWHAAADHALVRAATAVKQSGSTFWKGEHMRIVVTDPIGTAIFELRLSGHLPLETHGDGPIDPPLLN